MNLSSCELQLIEQNILNCIKSIYHTLAEEEQYITINNTIFLSEVDNNIAYTWVENDHTEVDADDLFSLNINEFSYYFAIHRHTFHIPDTTFNLEEDFFQISTMYPFAKSTYLEIKQLREFLISKEIFY